MKYPKLAAFLGLAVVNQVANLFGSKTHVRLSEEECQKLEDHFATEPSADQSAQLTALQTKFDALQENYNKVEASNVSLTTALQTAVELNGLTAETETATPEEAIALLGTKCKKYGSSENRHSFPGNDGNQKDNTEDPSAEYEHNQVMTDKSKFKTIS